MYGRGKGGIRGFCKLCEPVKGCWDVITKFQICRSYPTMGQSVLERRAGKEDFCSSFFRCLKVRKVGETDVCFR